MNETLCCRSCGLMMQDDSTAYQINCPRCEAPVRKKPSSIEHDLGLSIAALIVFFPAMLLPIISFQLAGSVQENSMFSSYPYFLKDGYPELGALVFFTSILTPFLQIIISFLLYSALYQNKKPRFMKLYFNILHTTRHWVMLEVYLIAILVSTVKLTQTSEVIYGNGLIFFVALASFSFLLSKRFCPKKIWKAYHNAH